MVATPYLLVAVVAFFVYRGLKRKYLEQQAALRQIEEADAAAPRPTTGGGAPQLS